MKTIIAHAVELVYRAIPYSTSISELDFTSDPNAIRFKWRGTTYRVSDTLHVEEVGDGVLVGSDRAILIEALLKRVYLAGYQQ